MIPSAQSIFDYSVASHSGKGNETNEDRYHVESFALTEDGKGDSLFAILADGVGSRRAGQVAAELAVETIGQSIAKSDASQPFGILQAAIIQASQIILFRSEVRPEWNGMGSTCLCAWLVGYRLFAASVGTSRMYLLRNKVLKLLNTPQLNKDRLNKKWSAKDQPAAAYLGSASPLDIELSLGAARKGSRMGNNGLRLLPNDRLLLCTDGVGDALTTTEIIDTLGYKGVAIAAHSLVDLALEKGAPHNLTAAVIAVPPGRPPLAKNPLNWRRVLAGSAVFILLVMSGLFTCWLWQLSINPLQPPQPTPLNTLTPIATNTPQ